MRKTMYLYIVECSDGTLYVGVTTDLEKRIYRHQTGYYKNSYTSTRRPVTLVYQRAFSDFYDAFDWETKVKKWSNAKKKALINGDYDKLKVLAKKKF
jgi:putative endonuclease